MQNRPLILISNDDGVLAQGIGVLAALMRPLGDVVVVAPDGPRSGASCSITPVGGVSVRLLSEEEGLRVYSCTGTPTDCVKLALEKVVPRRPALVASGINHGDNASVSTHYSGTMGAVMEACMKGVPAVGYSLRTRDRECDFAPYAGVITDVARHVLEHGLERDVFLNVNFPQVAELRGARVCRLARGLWHTEWLEGDEPGHYRMTGTFANLEPEAEDTDYWALDHGMASITPQRLDMTAYASMDNLKALQR